MSSPQRVMAFDQAVVFELPEALLDLTSAQTNFNRKSLDARPRTAVVARILHEPGEDELVAGRQIRIPHHRGRNECSPETAEGVE